MDRLMIILTIISALGSGLVAGIFFIFSNTIMKAFGRLSACEGIAAMNMINVVIINPMFLGVFLGTAIVCVVLVVFSIVRWHESGSGYILGGAAIYIVGSLFVTMVFNVPMNDTLAASPDDTALWTKYLSDWTFWNHIRAAASLASTTLLVIALVYTGK